MKPARKPATLRIALIVIGAGMVLWGVRLWSMHEPSQAAVVLGIYGAALVAVLLIEHWRYTPNVDRSDAQWQPTEEKFVDPVTGNRVQVWFNPKTGQRDYRPL